LVDDPFIFGQIAAANALSDLYAMNARPLTALNIVGFPDDHLPLEILGRILEGAADRIRLAGAALIGGHTVRDAEIKFGLSATGLVHPDRLWKNVGARPGDRLLLTKPLGTGFVTTAAKMNRCPPGLLDRAVASMIQLNRVGQAALQEVGGARAVTDVTGFGLAGHASEMADGSNVTLEIDLNALPLLEGAETVAVPRFFTRASKTNRGFLDGRLEIAATADATLQEFAFDAQTSGGLLIAIEPERAEQLVAALQAQGAFASAIIGRVAERRGSIAVALR